MSKFYIKTDDMAKSCTRLSGVESSVKNAKQVVGSVNSSLDGIGLSAMKGPLNAIESKLGDNVSKVNSLSSSLNQIIIKYKLTEAGILGGNSSATFNDPFKSIDLSYRAGNPNMLKGNPGANGGNSGGVTTIPDSDLPPGYSNVDSLDIDPPMSETKYNSILGDGGSWYNYNTKDLTLKGFLTDVLPVSALSCLAALGYGIFGSATHIPKPSEAIIPGMALVDDVNRVSRASIASALFMHYLDGSGAAVTYPASCFLQEDNINYHFNDNLSQIASYAEGQLQDGETIRISVDNMCGCENLVPQSGEDALNIFTNGKISDEGFWDAVANGFDGLNTEALSACLAFNQADASVVCEITRNGDEYTMNYRYYIVDYYDFDDGCGGNPESVYNLYLYGMAHDFMSYGEIDGVATWSAGDDSLNNIYL